MAPIIQYTVFPASNDFTKDQSRFKDALEALTSAEGHTSSFYGLQEEEEVWESVEHQKKFRESAQGKFSQLFNSLKEAVAGELVQHQFTSIKGTPLPGFESANTEFVIITPKDGVSLDQVKEMAFKAYDVWNGNGHPSAVNEGDGMFLVTFGWDSTAHHVETVKNEPYHSFIGEFAAIAKFDISHANLKKQK
ncbi:hypothetical protein BT96DRAFT_924471 [Gymnopus androsaceus JB14]|uniref:ABM domain-containing protein n=1 Tax=Gymnopus androsaceus JB14 TaxID=1447944 RepID=A0A6A4H516_9AGAR|nr:hypothetical protein BT96DRAFT_924471 [Gymnopus androsaceus JB14]